MTAGRDVPAGQSAAIGAMARAILVSPVKPLGKPALHVVTPAELDVLSPRVDWAGRITTAWNKTRDGIIEVGQLLTEAKAGLNHGEFEAMISADLPFSPATAQRLMKIGGDARLTNPAHVQLLPSSWGTLYELTKLDDASFGAAIKAGAIRPDMERKEAERLRTAERRGERLARTEELSKASPPPASLKTERRYPVIYADPPWTFKTYTAAGKEKGPEQHYPTMATADIKALPVGDLAAKDASLFLWSTVGHLPDAMAVMAAWGFAYRSHVVWRKINADGSPHRGTGYWFVNTHELLLVCARGDVPAPVPGTQEESVISAPVGRHSEKPECFRMLIERYFPDVGRIELFARKATPGWAVWGAEANNGAV